MFIMGDFNLDLLKYDYHAATNDFVNNCMSHSFLPTICHPTRITESTATLLDNIFTNNLRHRMETAILYTDISDHLPVVMHIDLKLCKNKFSNSHTTRLYSLESIEQFKLALGCTRWDDVCNDSIPSDPNKAYNIFSTRFSQIFDVYFPEKTVRHSRAKTPRKEWITKELIKSCNKKSVLYKNLLKTHARKLKKNTLATATDSNQNYIKLREIIIKVN